jgi:membrane protein DedA with SNARE-associated domain
MDVSYNGYLGVFVALVASTTFLPVPEEVPVIAAGVMCGKSDTTFADDRDNPARLKWWYMLPVVIVGAVLGDVVLYTIGRLWGRKLFNLKWVQRRIVSPEKVVSLEKNFAKRGIVVLLGVRLLPGIRGPVFLVAGMVRLPLWQFLVADAIYAIPVVNIMFWTAYWLTDQILVLVNEIDKYKTLVASHLLAGVAGAFIYKYLLTRRVPTGEATPMVSKAEAIGHAIETALESAVDVVTGRHHHPPDESGPQESEDKKQETGDKKSETDNRAQRTEDRDQKTEDRKQEAETKGQETGDRKPATEPAQNSEPGKTSDPPTGDKTNPPTTHP